MNSRWHDMGEMTLSNGRKKWEGLRHVEDCAHAHTCTCTHRYMDRELTYIVKCTICPPFACQKVEAAEKATVSPAAPWALPEGLEGNAWTVTSLVLCFCTVQDFHVPSFPNSVAGGIYSHMLSQIDTQWYHTRPSQQFQVLFFWRQKLEIKYLEKSRSLNILWKGLAFSHHEMFCCLYCPEVMKIYQNTEYSNNVGLGLTSPWKPCVL